MEIEEVKKTVAKIVAEELKGTEFKAFFFGSRITGSFSPASDLDVGIEGVVALPADILRKIKSQCEALPTLYTIDIVYFSLISDDFKKVAKQKVEVIV